MIGRGLITGLCWAVMSTAAVADMLTPVRTIRANSLITAEDVKLVGTDLPNVLVDLVDVVGKEARRNLYAGRPIRSSDVGRPALVERNDVVPLIFISGGLAITTEGRALGRGGVGDALRVMNLSSRNTVVGLVNEAGAVRVGQ